MSVRAFIGLAMLTLPVAATAQAIDAGAPEGAEQTAFAERAFDTYELPIAAFGGEDKPTQLVEGRTRWAAHHVSTESVGSTGAVIEGYRDRFSDQGFETILDCTGKACGGFDFRFGATLLPPPGMQMDVEDFAQLTMQRPNGDGYVSVLASRVRDRVFIQTVSVVPSAGGTNIVRSPKTETAEETVVPTGGSSGLMDRLKQEGRVPVLGLDFATGGATLSSTSGPAVDRLTRLLINNPEIRVAIVGHSDNQGGLDPNIALSERRAQAVMQALIAKGIAQGRLEARGIGYLAPLASNATAEGRAVNRRVELVLR